MSEKQWPIDWPNPDDHKKRKKGAAVLDKLNASTTAIGTAIFVLSVVLLTRGFINWMSTPTLPPAPITIPIDTPIRPIVIEAPDNNSHSCTVDLRTQQHNCHHLQAVQFTQPINNGRTAVKLNLDPFTTGYTAARFAVTYGEFTEGWTLNIGDSASNNGYGGDAHTQSNDAELQIFNGHLSVYGNDYTQPHQTTDSHRHILSVEDAIEPNSTILIEVGNQKLWWLSEKGHSERLQGPFLFALARQPDEEGATNYDLYAAFNQTITGSQRTGHGVERVTITLIPAE